MRLQTEYASCKENGDMLHRSSLRVAMLSQALTTELQQPASNQTFQFCIYTVKEYCYAQSCSQHRFRIRQTENVYSSISFRCTLYTYVCVASSPGLDSVTAKHFFKFCIVKKKASVRERIHLMTF